MSQPFANLDQDDWPTKRDDLIQEYPLSLEEIKDIIFRSYKTLCKTRIGDPDDDIKIFRDVEVRAQTVGAFLETIIANEFQKEDSVWRQGSDAEKDLVHTNNPEYSTELKLSGQVNDEIFGNRSFAQEERQSGKKGKSGYYIGVNVHISEEVRPPSNKVFLTRFGWLDFDDWVPQNSQSGQSAKLESKIYENKLRVIEGEYLRNAPIELLGGIGETKFENVSDFLEKKNITTVGEFVDVYEDISKSNDTLDKIYKSCMKFPTQSNISMNDSDMNLFSDTSQTRFN